MMVSLGTNPHQKKSLEIFCGFFARAGYSWETLLMDSTPPKDPLSDALQQWQVRPPLNPQFRPAVWQRIAQHSRDSWAGYVRAHRLTWTVATLVVMGGAGWTGHAVARAKSAADRDAMVVSYLVGLDPRVQAKLQP